jgi:hypothetical protein
MKIATRKNDEELGTNERNYYAWKCEIADARHRPNGRGQNQGCGNWQVKSSKWKSEEAPHGLMVSCKHGCLGNGGKGPRKARLTPSTRKFYHFPTKDEAERFCEALNGAEGDSQ